MSEDLSLNELREMIRKYVNERDWEQFHNPKDLALALNLEISEVLEHFRFKNNDEINSYIKDFKNKKELGHEISDVLYFLVRLADVMSIDLPHAFKEKFEVMKEKYPIEKAKGSSKKYTEL
ncbi:MAG: nucleotide pyrophosphohydrolase [Nanoarchaeota archaeon]